jgi:membrane protease YdiL (CAAX protease family)
VHVDPREASRRLLIHLYASQAVLMLTGTLLLHWVDGGWHRLFFRQDPVIWWSGLGFGVLVVIADMVLTRVVPAHWWDDGGINRLLFQSRSFAHIVWIAWVVAVAEELLFRGALQSLIGLWVSSLLFTLVHFRYWKRIPLLLMVFAVSLGLGVLVEWSGSLVPAIVAHFVIDCVTGVRIRLERGDRS